MILPGRIHHVTICRLLRDLQTEDPPIGLRVFDSLDRRVEYEFFLGSSPRTVKVVEALDRREWRINDFHTSARGRTEWYRKGTVASVEGSKRAYKKVIEDLNNPTITNAAVTFWHEEAPPIRVTMVLLDKVTRMLFDGRPKHEEIVFE